MRRHTHSGRPKWTLLWDNQYGKKWQCTKCDYTKSKLTELGFVKFFGLAASEYRKKLIDNIFTENIFFKMLKNG